MVFALELIQRKISSVQEYVPQVRVFDYYR